MSDIKKVYKEVVALLEASANKKVSTIMPEIIALCEGKTNSKTFHKDEDGKVIAVFCYYHKVWELVDDVEYGEKKSTSTGLNTMCKEGVSLWTKQQRIAKKAKEELLDAIASGELEGSGIGSAMASIEEARVVIEPQDERVGFATLEEALAFNA